MKYRSFYARAAAGLLCLSVLFSPWYGRFTVHAAEEQDILSACHAYQKRLSSVKKEADIAAYGFDIIENQVFSMTVKAFGDVSMIPALDRTYHRLVLFFTDEDGNTVYSTDQLETNNQVRGELRQLNQGISAVSFQDLNGDDKMDILLITSCEKNDSAAGKAYKVGDVLFQNEHGFYRDWRLSDKINRFGMNKSIRFIESFLGDGYST